jgi:hypothetical protein
MIGIIKDYDFDFSNHIPDNKLALSRGIKVFTKYLKEVYENDSSNKTTI